MKRDEFELEPLEPAHRTHDPRHAVLLFETPVELFTRVYRELRPRAPMPDFSVHFARFANANSFVRLENGRIEVRITDALEQAPAPILEALAYILLSKLYRKPVPREFNLRYRRFLNSRDMRERLEGLRQSRGWKLVDGPQGECHNLEELFEELNFRYFHGLMARPALGWSRKASRTHLGHYDPSHNAIVLSRILDRADVPRIAAEYVMFHEMLHLRYPVQHKGTRRCVHTREFKEAEKQFEGLAEAKAALKHLPG